MGLSGPITGCGFVQRSKAFPVLLSMMWGSDRPYQKGERWNAQAMSHAVQIELKWSVMDNVFPFSDMKLINNEREK